MEEAAFHEPPFILPLSGTAWMLIPWPGQEQTTNYSIEENDDFLLLKRTYLKQLVFSEEFESKVAEIMTLDPVLKIPTCVKVRFDERLFPVVFGASSPFKITDESRARLLFGNAFRKVFRRGSYAEVFVNEEHPVTVELKKNFVVVSFLFVNRSPTHKLLWPLLDCECVPLNTMTDQ